MLQIQPLYQNINEWISFAKRESLFFELHELIKVLATSPEAYGKECIEISENCGLSASFHGAYIDINPFSGDPDIAELSRKKVEFSCSLAQRVGAENIVFHCSCFPMLRGAYFNSHVRQAGEYYSELSERTGLNIFLENSFDMDPDPLAGIMENASSPKVKCCLDIGHANLSRAPLDTWFDTLNQHIGYLHLSDNTGSWDDHLPIGTGNIRWENINEQYMKLSRDIPVTLETVDLESTVRSYEYLKERGFFHA